MARAPARGPRDGRAFKGLPMRRILSERIGTNFDDLAWHADAGRSFAILHTASTDPVTDAINFVRTITATLLGAHPTGIDHDSLRSATSQPGSASAAKQSLSGRKAGGAAGHTVPRTNRTSQRRRTCPRQRGRCSLPALVGWWSAGSPAVPWSGWEWHRGSGRGSWA
jgi:uncharacterized protein YfiM (DUF2279 family)